MNKDNDSEMEELEKRIKAKSNQKSSGFFRAYNLKSEENAQTPVSREEKPEIRRHKCLLHSRRAEN